MTDDMSIRATRQVTALLVAKKGLPTVTDPVPGDLVLASCFVGRILNETARELLPSGAVLVRQRELNSDLCAALDSPLVKQTEAVPATAVPARAPAKRRVGRPTKLDDASWYEGRSAVISRLAIGSVVGWLARRGQLSELGVEVLGEDGERAGRGEVLASILCQSIDGKLGSDLAADSSAAFLVDYLDPSATPTFHEEADAALGSLPPLEQDGTRGLNVVAKLLDERWSEWKRKQSTRD